MQEGWRKFKLEDISSIKSGKRLPKGHSLISDKTEYPYIRLVNIKNNKIQKDEMLFLKQETQRVIAKYIVNEKDVCFAIVGDTIGLVFYIDKNFNGANLTENAARLTDFSVFVNSKYVYYYLFSPIGYREIMSRKVGSAQGKLPLYNIKSLEISIPPLQEQEAIASILSALDDKIELNLQMNKTLEEMAMALYKHWFVDFGPFQNGKFVESELGMIPEGWEVKRLNEVTQEIRRGISPNYTEGEGIEVVNQRCIRNHEVDFSLTRKHDINKKKIDGRLIEIGDVLVNSTGVGTLGRMAPVIQLKGNTVVDSHVTVVRVNTNKFLINNFARLMLHIEPIVEGLGEGSTGQTELSRVALGEIKVLVPPLIEQKHLEVHFQLFSETVANNLNSNQTLTTLRDTLLPKLISGEVRVKDIEQMVAASL